MRKLLVLFLMGVSSVALAAVVPTESTSVRRPSVTRPDATKQKMLVKTVKLEDSVGADNISDLERYQGVVTLDNVKAIENMSGLMQDNPVELFAQMGVETDKMGFDIDSRALGTDEMVPAYQKTPDTKDPKEKLGKLHVPALTGTFSSIRESEAELKAVHANALAQMEAISHQSLGQKMAPIQMPMTVEDIKKSGIDTRRLPKGWEEVVERAEGNRKLYNEQQAREKQKEIEKRKAVAENQKTEQKVSTQGKTAAKPAVKTQRSK